MSAYRTFLSETFWWVGYWQEEFLDKAEMIRYNREIHEKHPYDTSARHI